MARQALFMKKKTLLRSVNERSLKNSKIKEKSKKKHFFKKKEKLSQPFRFPNIFRIITEKYFLGFIVTFILVAMLIIVGLDLYKDIKNQQKIEKERKDVISKIQYWQGVIDKYKDYRDAYFQLAILEYRLKNFDKAKFYLDKSLSLDPNFEKGRTMEKILKGLQIRRKLHPN